MNMNVEKHPVHRLLTNVTELGINNFTDIAVVEGKDVLVFFFYPSSEQK